MTVYPHYAATKMYDVDLYLSAYKYGHNILLGEKSRFETSIRYFYMFTYIRQCDNIGYTPNIKININAW